MFRFKNDRDPKCPVQRNNSIPKIMTELLFSLSSYQFCQNVTNYYGIIEIFFWVTGSCGEVLSSLVSFVGLSPVQNVGQSKSQFYPVSHVPVSFHRLLIWFVISLLGAALLFYVYKVPGIYKYLSSNRLMALWRQHSTTQGQMFGPHFKVLERIPFSRFGSKPKQFRAFRHHFLISYKISQNDIRPPDRISRRRLYTYLNHIDFFGLTLFGFLKFGSYVFSKLINFKLVCVLYWFTCYCCWIIFCW